MSKQSYFGVGSIGLLVIIVISIYFMNNSDNQEVVNMNKNVVKEFATPSKVEASENAEFVGTLVNVKGDVFVRKSGEEMEAENGMKIGRGWEVITKGQSSAVVVFTSEMKAVLGENTEIVIEGTDGDEASDNIRLNHISGTLWNTGHHESYVVQTPDMSMNALGTNFFVAVDPVNQQTILSVFSGLVGVTHSNGLEEEVKREDMVVIIPSLLVESVANDSPGYGDSFDHEFNSDLIDTIKNDRDLGFIVRPFEPDSFINHLNPEMIKEIMKSKPQIDEENENMLDVLARFLQGDDISDNELLVVEEVLQWFNSNSNHSDSETSMDEADLERYHKNINGLIGAIIERVIKDGKMTQQEIEDLIRETGVNIDLVSDERSVDHVREERDLHKQEEMEHRQQELEHQLRQREVAQEHLEELKKQRERKRLEEALKNREEERKRLEAALKNQEEQRKRLEEERKKVEEEHKKKEEEKSKPQRPEIPEYVPEKITFDDKNPLAEKLAGEVKITKAIDETNINQYALYWANSKQGKLDKIATLNKTGQDVTFTFLADTNLPENVTGLLAVSVNDVGESEDFAYVEISDYQAITVKNPISDQELFREDYKYLDMENIFMDPFGEFINPDDDSPYEITIKSSNEDIVYAIQDAGGHISSQGQLGEAIVTITVTNLEDQETITHSFKVEVKEPGITGNASLTAPVSASNIQLSVVALDQDWNRYETFIDLIKGQKTFTYHLPLSPGSYSIYYGLTHKDTELDEQNAFHYQNREFIHLEKEERNIDLDLNVMNGVTVKAYHDGFGLEFGNNHYAFYEVVVDNSHIYTSLYDDLTKIDGLDSGKTYQIRVTAQTEEDGNREEISAIWMGAVTTMHE